MAISATYISVILLLCVLIGFVLSVILTLTRTTGSRIRKDMNKTLDLYNQLLNSKMEEYSKLQKKDVSTNIMQKESYDIHTNQSVQNVSDKFNRISSSSYVRKEATHRIASLAKGYDSIKSEFRNYASKIEDTVKSISEENRDNDFEEAITRLNNTLSVDTVYEISLLPNNEQLSFFKEVFDEKDKVALDAYLELFPKEFNCIDFYDWIKITASSISKEIVIRSGETSSNVDYEYDPSICEGCQIVTGNRIYDYSISQRDIQ